MILTKSNKTFASKTRASLREPFQLKIASHRQVLNTIRIKKEISGADLARLNNLQPSTLVYILRSLKEKGLIEVSRIDNSSGITGKPPTLWRLVADKGYIVGLEIIPNETRSTVIDFSGKIIHQEHTIGLDNIGPDRLIPSINSFFRALLNHLDIPKRKIFGVGMALTGLVDRERGLVRYSRKLNLNNYPVGDALEKGLGLPIEVVNDANAGALGIKWQIGDDRQVDPNVIFLTLNEKTGYFGAGLILNKVLYEGALGSAGELFTSLPSLSKLFERAERKYGSTFQLLSLDQQKGEIDIEDVIKCARRNCKGSLYILKQYSRFVVEEIVRLVQLLNPHMIVLGGDITDARDLIYDNIVNTVNSRLDEIFVSGMPVPRIEFSRFGIYSVSVGATALILRNIFV